jgi:hypothetical protein
LELPPIAARRTHVAPEAELERNWANPVHRGRLGPRSSVAFFYACALLSLSVTALVFINKASAQHGGHVSGYERAPRASL